MKLLCVLEPNSAGHVHVSLGNNPRNFKEYVFLPDESDELVAEVDNDDHVAHLLKTGNFVPYGEGDYQAASAILESDVAGDTEADTDLESDVAGDTEADTDLESDDDGDDDDEVETEGDGLPVEALTPRSNRKPRKAQAE